MENTISLWLFLIVHSAYDYTLTDIMKHSKTGYGIVKTFIDLGYIKKLDNKRYTLDREHKTVKKFEVFYWDFRGEFALYTNRYKKK